MLIRFEFQRIIFEVKPLIVRNKIFKFEFNIFDVN